MRGPSSLTVLVLAAGLFGFVVMFLLLPRWYGPAAPGAPGDPAAPAPDAAGERRITATLFYISEDSRHLVGIQREVPFGEGTTDQARRIVEEQLREAPAPLVSAVPPGTRLRALYLSEDGHAFVDLSRNASSAHPGGSLYELFTVYTLVNALTVNLPAVDSVQLLIEGQEVETLAGHVDLRHPLQKNLRWVAGGNEE